MPGRDRLTDRQQQVLDFIQAKIHRDGYPPTIREIGDQLGIRSTNGVNDHLKALSKKGYLQRTEAKSRACVPTGARGEAFRGDVVPVDEMDDMIDIPVLGKIAAGQPILALEQQEDSVRIDRVFLGKNRDVFGLRVVGESMIEDGIHDGDFIFVKKAQTASRGDIVVAMIEDEATVKRYYPEGDQIRFQPANSRMKPIMVSKRDFKSVNLIGIVIGLYRKV